MYSDSGSRVQTKLAPRTQETNMLDKMESGIISIEFYIQKN